MMSHLGNIQNVNIHLREDEGVHTELIPLSLKLAYSISSIYIC